MENVNEVTRVYSVDNKIWVGMKTQDANTTEEDMKLFNFADQDGNGEISESELDRYNGPLLVENFPEKTGRIIGHAGPFGMNGLIIMDNEVDYYPGLKLEQVDKTGRVVYNQIDTNHDSVLSAEEMETVANAIQRVDEAKVKLDKIENKREGFDIAGLIGGSLCLIMSALVSDEESILDFLKGLVVGKNSAIRASRYFAIGGLVIAGLALTNRFVAKHKAKKVMESLQDINHPYTREKQEQLKTIV